MSAEAEVLADSEPKMSVRVAVDTKAERIVEDIFVTVGRRIEQHHAVALGDLLPTDHSVNRRCSFHVVDGRRPSNDLLDGGLHEFRMILQLAELVGVFEKGVHPPDQCVLGGVVAGAEDDQVVADRFHRPEWFTVDRRVRQYAREVTGRIGSAIMDDAVEQSVELHPQVHDRLLSISALTLEIGVIESEQFVGEAQDVGLLFAGHSEHVGKDAKWVGGGNIACELAFPFAALTRQPVHDFACAAIDVGIEGSDSAWREDVARDLSCIAVLGWIHLDDDAHGVERTVLQRVLLTPGEHSDAGLGEEVLGMSGNFTDVRVLGDRPEGFEHLRFASMNWRLGPQASPEVVWYAVLPVGLRRDQLVAVGDRHQMPPGRWLAAGRRIWSNQHSSTPQR